MRDGIRLAVSTWLPVNLRSKDSIYTAVLTTTRYWRAKALHQDNPEQQSYFYPSARYLLEQGYVLVAVDARGSGASFGCREAEISPSEVEDIGEIIEWIARQDWCDGRVATEGTSYTANTTLYSLVTAPPVLKVGVCRAPDFDLYRHLFAPGGIANNWFIEGWGGATSALDNNNIEALYADNYWPSPESGADNILGVRPVDEDEDGSLIAEAVNEHQRNFNVMNKGDKWMFVDHKPFGNHRFLFEPVCQQRIEKANVPVVIRCGWHDAGTALGALAMFASFNSPLRVILGPWSHSGGFRADPFLQGDGTEFNVISPETVFGLTVKSLDATFKQNKLIDKNTDDQFGLVEYYTLGENRWKTTRQWPLPQTKTQRLYLAADHQLSKSIIASEEGWDLYHVEPTAATGLNNRWHAQTSGKPILFPDRQEDDKKLLVYDTPPLENDTEITGHPVVHLYVRSSTTDGQFFVYLETVDPDGRVRLLTEGQLRGLHRKISGDTPPYKMFGPYHSLKEKDALPLVPGEVAEIAFDLFPISVLLKKGQRIRLAIAGADADVFAPIAGCENPEITVERNSMYASRIDLPIIDRETKNK
jgi:putative CocE/NonD family hydrolase